MMMTYKVIYTLPRKRLTYYANETTGVKGGFFNEQVSRIGN